MSRRVVDLLPSSLAGDAAMLAAAEMLDAEFARVDALMPLVAPWQALERLTEPMLSALAAECAVDVWEPQWSDGRKRTVLASALSVHRRKGTARAVVDGLTAMGFRARHVNWPEYDGTPYTFRLEVDVLDQGADAAAYGQILRSIDETKAGRSHLDRLDVYLSGQGRVAAPVAAQVGVSLDVYPWIPEDQNIAGGLRSGAGLAVYTIIDIEPQGAGA
ncbi:phage tail protein I [Pseudodesulfovibrio pelocollis]|uniref:phage tail protein I n=1 Tax=Pseudodesulfovibrio pelocollis TaxID=3051432 RepID=UPI00255B240A|nr:phage tail protein I [Pseudodesulfovibrio sp. SB368]